MPGSLTLDSAGLSDADDSDAGSASDAGGVRVALGTVSGGTSHAISFAVVIEE